MKLTALAVMLLTAPGWFDDPVDFWDRRAPVLAPQAPSPAPRPAAVEQPAVEESIWAEPTRLPDGRWVIYLPPAPVLAHLTNPTRESARAYLAWQRERTETIARAAALVQEVAEEDEVRPTPQPLTPGQAPRYQLLYFFRPDCPHCERQGPLLGEWAARHKDVALSALDPASEQGRAFGVTVTPTLVLLDTETHEATRHDGYAEAATLEAMLETLR
ncbi:MAG: hypothetical protein HY722_04845 [Planctomycetes bacterium]|nr:hypothetical protein [Planctomycetota bacterium]